MYLNIDNKSYMLTESYNKPYMQVSNSVLPITTNTNGGGEVQLQLSGSKYRPMTYGPATTTFYTSGLEPGDMYSTTALTEQVTTGTSYLTSESAYAVSIMSINSTSEVSFKPKHTTYGANGQNIWLANNQNKFTITERIKYSITSVTTSRSYTGINAYLSNAIHFTNSFDNLTNKNYNTSSHTYSIYSNGYIVVTDRITWSVIEETTGTIYNTTESTTGYTGISSSVISGSSTWYTSNINSEGMYDTTALTEESTTGTSYLTSGDGNLLIYDRLVRGTNSQRSFIYSSTGHVEFTYTNIAVNSSYNKEYFMLTVSASAGRNYSYSNSSSTIYYRYYTSSQTGTYTTSISDILNNTSMQQGPRITPYKTFWPSDYIHANNSNNFKLTAIDYNNDTCYLTLTQNISTTSTSYLTEEVTTAYSGVSSSSSISYAWQ